MNVTRSRIITTLLRCLMTTALIPTIVTAGLLAVPTTCLCGAEMPHEHSLFEIHNHSHGAAADERPEEQSDDVDYDGPVVRAPSPSVSPGAIAGSLVSEAVVVSDVSTTTTIAYVRGFPESLHPTPEAPPPQA